MGVSYKGGSKAYRSIGQNILPTSASYSYRNGRFGESSIHTGNNTRNIRSQDNLSTAKDFYNKISYGGIEKTYENGNRKITYMNDGSVITWRKISHSDGTPVVEINIRTSTHSSGIKNQKIHFVREE